MAFTTLNTIRFLVLGGLITAAGTGQAQVHLTLYGVKHAFASQGTKHADPEPPELTRMGRLWNEAVHAGVAAYKKGELPLAEAWFLKARAYQDLYPGRIGIDSVLAGWLARIYSIQGRQDETYRELHSILYPPAGSFSSKQTDARVLLYYGDLCRTRGDADEAMSSYIRAVRAESKYTDDPLRTLFAEAPETRKLNDARSDAFAAAAMHAGFRTPTALNYAEAAVSLAPNRPLGRYVYGTVLYELKGRRVESLDQNWMAYQLAKGKSKQVLYDSGTKGDHLLINLRPEYTNDGRIIYHPEPYKPDKPVPTPKPKDLNSYLPDPY